VSGGSAAIEIREAARATALVIPDAMPAWSAGIDDSAADVSGGTVAAMPSPKRHSRGMTVVQ
jgi:hypothetical protein